MHAWPKVCATIVILTCSCHVLVCRDVIYILAYTHTQMQVCRAVPLIKFRNAEATKSTSHKFQATLSPRAHESFGVVTLAVKPIACDYVACLRAMPMIFIRLLSDPHGALGHIFNNIIQAFSTKVILVHYGKNFFIIKSIIFSDYHFYSRVLYAKKFTKRNAILSS